MASLEEDLALAELGVTEVREKLDRRVRVTRLGFGAVSVLSFTSVLWVVLGVVGAISSDAAFGLTWLNTILGVIVGTIVLVNLEDWRTERAQLRRTLRVKEIRRDSLRRHLVESQLSDAERIINDFNRVHGYGTTEEK